MKKSIVLLVALGLGLVSFAAETAPAGAIVGWWKFDDAQSPGKDSSGCGNDLDGLSNVTVLERDTGYGSKGIYDDSGCLQISTAGNTATATPKVLWDATKGYTYLMSVRSGVSISKTGADTQVDNLIRMFNKNTEWHLLSMRHDPNRVVDTGYRYWVFGDDPMVDANVRCEATSDSTSELFYPLSAAIAIGGKVGGSKSGRNFWADYKGFIDDVVVVGRTMTKAEIQRFYLTGSPHPYLMKTSSAAFSGADNWSCGKDGLTYAPSDLPGADFVVDGGLTVGTDTTAGTGDEGKSFGGRSLTLGHLSDLVNRLDGTTVATKDGNFEQKVNVTIGDLRLNSGKIFGAKTKTLTVGKLMVNAPESAPFEVYVKEGTYYIAGSAVGGGWIKKTGAGNLNIKGLSGDFRVKTEEGNVYFAGDDENPPVLMVK